MPLRRDIPAVASIENISEIPIDLFEIFKMKPKEVVEIDFTSLIERIANRVWDAAQNGAAGGVLKVTVIKSRVKEPPKPDNAPPEPVKPEPKPEQKPNGAPPVETTKPADSPATETTPVAPKPEAPAEPAPAEPIKPEPVPAPTPAIEPVNPTVNPDVKPDVKPVAPNPLAAFMKPAKKK
jgi:hypothetical protein